MSQLNIVSNSNLVVRCSHHLATRFLHIMYTVYCHTNKLNNKRYVGITKQNPKVRWQNGYGYRGNEYFFRAIQKYGWDNFNHEILYEGLTKKQAEEIEIRLIKEWHLNNRDFGYNISHGGNCLGSVSAETKQKISKAHKGVSTHNMTADVKKRISEKMSGRKLSEETKRKMSDYAKQRGTSDDLKEKLRLANERRKIPVICVETGIVYESASEAARQTGLCKSTILRHCEGKLKSGKWKYAKEE